MAEHCRPEYRFAPSIKCAHKMCPVGPRESRFWATGQDSVFTLTWGRLHLGEQSFCGPRARVSCCVQGHSIEYPCQSKLLVSWVLLPNLSASREKSSRLTTELTMYCAARGIRW